MTKVRFCLSVEPEHLAHFERWMEANGYTNRSEAFRDLVRQLVVEETWAREDREVSAVAVLVYDHHLYALPQHLVEEEHRHHELVLARTHVHLDEHNCLEVVLMRGPAPQVKALGDRLIARRGVKVGRLVPAHTGQGLP